MHLFPLSLFPETALASSVITTIWVGVFVVVFLNLRLGWVLAGLLIPGYLVPLIILKPLAAGIILIEGLLTYFVAYTFSEYFSRFRIWNNFFGHSRVLLLILSGVLVKTLLDGWLLPNLGDYVTSHYYVNFDFSNNLHSFGLIIITLIANNLWKSGIQRGLFPMAVTIGLTYILVRYVLMVYTNFHVSKLEYMYSDLASTILASPKAYIIIIVTAFICSRMRLKYGWELNGILIPALLALQWYRPLKIITSFGEALIILIIATLLLKLPIFSRSTIEGSRKILLFFNISFIYKFCLGYFLLAFFPEVKIVDYYGFGYLIPTYLAIMMHDSGVVGRLVRTTLQTSLVSVILASIIGFGLTFIPNPYIKALAEVKGESEIVRVNDDLVDVVRHDKINLYSARLGNLKVPYPLEIDIFNESLKAIDQYLTTTDPKYLDNAAQLLKKIKFQLKIINNRYLYIIEEPPIRGWGMYILDIKAKGQLLVEVPEPLDEWGSLESAIWLFKTMNASAVAISSAARETTGVLKLDVLKNHQTMYQAFHKKFSKQDVLQVRSYSLENAHTKSNIWVKGKLPADLDLKKLKSLIDDYEINWGKTPADNIQRDTTRAGFTELVLNRTGVRNIMSRGFVVAEEIPLVIQEMGIEGQLGAWLLNYKKIFPELGTNIYRKPSLEDLLYVDEEIVTPLIRLIKSEYKNGQWSTAGLEELKTIGIATSAIGYRMVRYKQKDTDHEFIILEEIPNIEKMKFWGAYVFRLTNPREYIIEIPRPLFELNAFEYAVGLFAQTDAIALLIGGTHPFANQDYSSDIIRSANKENVFNVVYQSLMRDLPNELIMVVQVRGFGIKQAPQTQAKDAMVALGIGFGHIAQQRALADKFIGLLNNYGLSTEMVEGDPVTAGYEITVASQYQYLNATRNKLYSVVWLAPWIRADYRQQMDNRVHQAQFLALNIPSVTAELYSTITNRTAGILDQKSRLDLIQDVKTYVQSYDIVDLENLKNKWSRFKFKHVLDQISGQSFLILSAEDDKLIMIANLFPIQEDKEYLIKAQIVSQDKIFDFILQRSAFLYFEELK